MEDIERARHRQSDNGVGRRVDGRRAGCMRGKFRVAAAKVDKIVSGTE